MQQVSICNFHNQTVQTPVLTGSSACISSCHTCRFVNLHMTLVRQVTTGTCFNNCLCCGRFQEEAKVRSTCCRQCGNRKRWVRYSRRCCVHAARVMGRVIATCTECLSEGVWGGCKVPSVRNRKNGATRDSVNSLGATCTTKSRFGDFSTRTVRQCISTSFRSGRFSNLQALQAKETIVSECRSASDRFDWRFQNIVGSGVSPNYKMYCTLRQRLHVILFFSFGHRCCWRFTNKRPT